MNWISINLDRIELYSVRKDKDERVTGAGNRKGHEVRGKGF